jgi:hypothetical protein
LRELDEREPDERLATVPDFFVEEVRLEAAAARLGADFDALRDLEAELRDEDFTVPRLELRDAVFLAEERDAPERAEEDLREAAEAFLAVVFLAVVFFAVVFLAPDLAEDFEADFDVDFAAVFVPDFLAPELFEPDFLALEELLRELLFFAVFLVLVAPVSPVNSIVSGFDLVSVGIAASFKGLRVQPSRLQGNVVIPRGFRITESVDSRTLTFSVDISRVATLFTCACKTQYRVFDEAFRVSSWDARERPIQSTASRKRLKRLDGSKG